MKEKEIYKLRLKDFIPIVGANQYDDRIDRVAYDTSISKRVERRGLILSIYNTSVMSAAAGFILGVVGDKIENRTLENIFHKGILLGTGVSVASSGINFINRVTERWEREKEQRTTLKQY